MWLDHYQPLVGVRLNMVVNSSGNFVDSEGSSRGISNELDRKLIVHLRQISDIYVTGGNTYRNEGYRVPKSGALAVITRNETEPNIIGLTPPNAEPTALWSLDKLKSLGFRRVLLEVGPSLAKEFLTANLVDEYCLTITGGNSLQGEKVVRDLGSSLNLASEITIEGTCFTIWRRGNK